MNIRADHRADVADQEQGYVCQGGEWVEDDAVETYSSSSEKNSSFGKNLDEISEPTKLIVPSEVIKGSMTDTRDGRTYKTVTIGSQTWMAENLNYGYKVNGTSYETYTNPYCDKCGRYYTWAAAKTACPSGWHLPTKAEYETLFTTVGGSPTVGNALKSATGWDSDGNGEDTFGFSALPAGKRDSYGDFDRELKHAHFWSSTEYENFGAYHMYLSYCIDDAYLLWSNKSEVYSVRCLKD